MRTWPPQWSNAYQPKRDWPYGEIGVLETAWMHELVDRCVFLHVRHDGFQYTGSMYFDDRNSCLMIYHFLKTVLGRSVAEIGETDVSHLL